MRDVYADELIAAGRAEEALRNLLVENTTGITTALVSGHDFMGEIKFVSAVTLRDLVGPFDVLDYLESDIQQSEIVVFPPYMDLLSGRCAGSISEPTAKTYIGRCTTCSSGGVGHRLQLRTECRARQRARALQHE